MNPASSSRTTDEVGRVVTGFGAVTTVEAVSSTSPIRSAHTMARGASINKKVAIITAIRICTR